MRPEKPSHSVKHTLFLSVNGEMYEDGELIPRSVYRCVLFSPSMNILLSDIIIWVCMCMAVNMFSPFNMFMFNHLTCPSNFCDLYLIIMGFLEVDSHYFSSFNS